MGNVRSIGNKTDEFSALIKTEEIPRVQHLLFHRDMATHRPSRQQRGGAQFKKSAVSRNFATSGKKTGEGIALCVKEGWCNPGHVNEPFCGPGIKLLAVGLRP